ncbi:MAG: sulfotransferase domain-containing protein [Pseudomonadota bacterium]
MKPEVFDEDRPRVMVVSHERSGTHFIMNALAACYGYVSAPALVFDRRPVNINFYYPEHVRGFFAQFNEVPMRNIVKAHHAVEFFEDTLAEITKAFVIIYIYRDPRDVMISLHRFMNHWPWREGPKVETCPEFMRAAPCGQMLRYQDAQHETVLHRWMAHVDGWTLGPASGRNPRIVAIRYEDLDRDFESTIRSLGGLLGREPTRIELPDPNKNVVLPRIGDRPDRQSIYAPADLDWIESVAGKTMGRLGYL